MKITRIKTFKCSVSTGQVVRDPGTGELIASTSKSWLFLKIETDTELAGWGEGTIEWFVPPVEAMLHCLEELLIGQDPLQVAALTDDITNRLPWKGGSVLGTAVAAINMALHDLAGRAWGVPAHVILGGRRRDKVRVYSGGDIFRDPESAVEAAGRVQAAGFAGVKGNPLESRTWPMDRSVIDHCVACIEAIRAELGPQFDIMLDTHGSPQPELSLEFARRAAATEPLFLEEPVKFGSLEALLDLSRKSPVPIATGEKLFTVRDFQYLIDARACAFLQPDIAHCFGLSTYMEIARRARDSQMLMAPHCAGGPVFFGALLNAAAAVENFLIQEANNTWYNSFPRFVDHDWTIKDGSINVTDRPGLGVDVKEADLEKLPYEPMAYRQYRHQDGSWKGW